MDELHQSLQVLDRALRKYAVPEVEDVAGPPAGGLDDPASAVLDQGPGPEQQGGVQIALDAAVVSDHAPGLPQVDPPVEADHVAAGVAQQCKDAGGAGAEMNRRPTCALQAGKNARHVGPDVAAGARGAEGTQPPRRAATPPGRAP